MAMNFTKMGERFDWFVRGHFIWTLLISLGAGTGVKALLHSFTKIPPVWITPLWLLSAAVVMLLFTLWRLHVASRGGLQGSVTTALAKNDEDFSIQEFLKKTYKSDMTDEMAAKVSKWIGDIPAKERDAAFTQFATSGLIAYMHDQTWWTILRSQLSTLDALNIKPLRREQVKERFYDKAVAQFPNAYVNYTFDQWLVYMKRNTLILELPAETIGITVRGKDFLKHVVHYGFSVNTRTF